MSTEHHNLAIENSKIDDDTLTGVRARLEESHGTVTFKDTSVKESNILPSTVCNITIQGGSHKSLRIGWYGSYMYRRDQASMLIDGDVNTAFCDFPPPIVATMNVRKVDSFHLRGVGTYVDVTLNGNLGVNIVANDGKSDTVILQKAYASYQSDIFFAQGIGGATRFKLWEASRNLAANLITSGHEIRQFCASMDIHERSNCLCALYYPLLMEAEPLAIAYYQLAHKERAANLPATFQGVTPAMLEDALNKRVLDSKKLSDEEMRKRIHRIAYLGEKKLDARFKKHGVQHARSLWS